jgi:hypothetical protein
MNAPLDGKVAVVIGGILNVDGGYLASGVNR